MNKELIESTKQEQNRQDKVERQDVLLRRNSNIFDHEFTNYDEQNVSKLSEVFDQLTEEFSSEYEKVSLSLE